MGLILKILGLVQLKTLNELKNNMLRFVVLEMVLPSASPENVMLKEKVNPPCGLLFCLSQPF